MKPEMIFYFSATHWDREWYKTVDEFRFDLVSVMDKVISTLADNPDFEIFTADGQTCILEDYLQIRSEKQPELARLIKSGRLIIGPWYTMPDEFLISSESIIQNLSTGFAIAKSYGVQPLKTGYVCDTFGHIANLPQILKGFGIDNAVISRGTNDSELDCFFEWKSPDGSSVLVFKTPETCGYGSFFFEALCEFYPDYTNHLDEITEKAIQYVERELTRTSVPYVILMDGMDHETIHGFMPEVLKRLSQHFNCNVVQKRLDEVFQTISGVTAKKTGELTSHGKDNVMHIKLIPHTLSSRYDLKKANDTCQNLLEHYAMPCAAIDTINGTDFIYSYISYAYHYLLQNHAHDSICGCSIDAVHREMLTRFEKAHNTSYEYFFRFISREYARVSASGGDCQVKIFNPLPYSYEGLLEFDIDFAPDFPVTELPYVKYEQRNSFIILDEQGNELKYNLIQAARNHYVKMCGGNKRIADPHRVAILSALKPMSFTSFTIKPNPNPYRITERFSTAPNACENEWIYFAINPNGTVTITDKKSNHTFHQLHSFIDCCEMGDGWFHIRPIKDRIISSLGAKVSIEKTFDGYASCKFMVRYELSLPDSNQSVFGFTNRSSQYQPYNIESEFTISRMSKLITIRTTVHNTVSDHRLQLHLPTNIASPVYRINQCNLIAERRTGMDNSHYEWKETDISEYPFENMVLLQEKSHGLLFLSKGGLHEVSCPGDKENSIDITLLRCFSKTTGNHNTGEGDGQLLGNHIFEYAIMPTATENDCELVKIKDQYVSGYKEFTIPEAANTKPLQDNNIPFTIHSENCAYITCMPAKENGIIIRIANYAGTMSEATITFSKSVQSAYLCDFLENPTADAIISGNQITVQAQAYQMINIHTTFC